MQKINIFSKNITFISKIKNNFQKTRLILLFLILLTSSTIFNSNNMVQVEGMTPLLPQKYEPTEHASSNPNLYVSAENSFFQNYFAGPQVIEVIVLDPDINRLDQAYGEPIVTVNSKRLRMAQTTDGSWHAFFADIKQAQFADSTQLSNSGKGLDFGQFCSSDSAIVSGVDFSETQGIAVARHFSGASNGTQTLGTCMSVNIGGVSNLQGGSLLNHVVRQNQTLNGQAPGGRLGQIATNSIAFSNAWPIIQLYDFSGIPEPVTIQYQKAGGVQSVNLIFDRIPSKLIKIVSNRYDFPQGAELQADLIDPQLNIDPTEEDSWTWGASINNSTMFYQAFDRSGNRDADGTSGMQDITGNLTNLMFNHNGKLIIIPRPQGVQVGQSQSNGIQTLFKDSTGAMRTQSLSGTSGAITGLEVQPNVGIFADYDSNGKADIKIIDNAKRDTSINARYNDISYSIVVKYHTGKLTMGWPSAQTSTDIKPTVMQSKELPSFNVFAKFSILKNLFFG